MFSEAIGFATTEITARIVDPAGTHLPSYSPAVAVGVASCGPVVDVPQVTLPTVCATVLLDPPAQSLSAAVVLPPSLLMVTVLPPDEHVEQ